MFSSTLQSAHSLFWLTVSGNIFDNWICFTTLTVLGNRRSYFARALQTLVTISSYVSFILRSSALFTNYLETLRSPFSNITTRYHRRSRSPHIKPPVTFTTLSATFHLSRSVLASAGWPEGSEQRSTWEGPEPSYAKCVYRLITIVTLCSP